MIGSNVVGWAYIIASAVTIILSAVSAHQIFGGCFSLPPDNPTGNSTDLKFYPDFDNGEKVIFWLTLALVTLVSAGAFYISIKIIYNRPNSCFDLNKCTPSLIAAVANIGIVIALLTVEVLAAYIVDNECGPQPYTSFNNFFNWIGDMDENQTIALSFMAPVPCLTFIVATITVVLMYTNDLLEPRNQLLEVEA